MQGDVERIEVVASSDEATVGKGDHVRNVFQHNERALILCVPKSLFPEADGGELDAAAERLFEVVREAMEGEARP